MPQRRKAGITREIESFANRLKISRCNFQACKSLKRFGERGRNRTFNLLIKSQLLCQLSYAPFDNLRAGRVAQGQFWRA